nr:hypothetical protein GCM10020093_064820 [Planobispora longispora]
MLRLGEEIRAGPPSVQEGDVVPGRERGLGDVPPTNRVPPMIRIRMSGIFPYGVAARPWDGSVRRIIEALGA